VKRSADPQLLSMRLYLEELLKSLVDGGFIQLPLLRRHRAVDQDFLLGWDLEVYIGLHSPEKKRGQNLVER